MTDQGTVVYVGEPDVVHALVPGGPGLVFGRDPDACDVVVWSALNEPTLSRRAGVLWLADGQLWLRNLSRGHDLLVVVPGQPPLGHLPPRAGADDPGAARTLPARSCLVLGPAGCELVVRPAAVTALTGAALPDDESDVERTLVVPAVPGHLRAVAEALCAPLLSGGALPATYAQICEQLGIESVKRVRSLVAELCTLYPDTGGATAAGAWPARRAREDELVSALLDHPAHRQTDGWRFDERPDPRAEAGAPEQRRALALPDHYEAAHLLVRHGLVGRSRARRQDLGAQDAGAA
ncbi:FHA domain-containing protein [Kineosporia sp. A_224]|uniref:FHA domain-containing protein n=1 Tax=Kineosporia sp. A_224 TaxID=1962180 RepID=UPI00117ACD91|nr:FHA domain-containing protein [Kineosporia sp. A_224]